MKFSRPVTSGWLADNYYPSEERGAASLTCTDLNMTAAGRRLTPFLRLLFSEHN